MSDPIVDAALARGALIVTPNKRLAREIASRHDRAQLAAGRTTWAAARVLPWMTFVGELVQIAQDAGLALPSHRLDPVQSAQLWQRVIRNDLSEAPLVSVDAAANLAAEAWERAHAYGSGADSWRGFAGSGPDVEAFVRWAGAYSRETARHDALDGARAADAIVAIASTLPGASTYDIALAGFVELSPQQQRLLDALKVAGTMIARCAPDVAAPLATTARLAVATTPQDELVAALDWAREHAARDPSARVAIVVLDLAERRMLVRALAEDRLCPALQMPGRESAARPYDISLGAPLADVPLVASALDLIALAARPLERARVATLLRSPYLPGAASAWPARAALERAWLEQGARELSWSRIVEALAVVDATLASRWHRADRSAQRPGRATPRAWVEHWRNWLADTGWGEGRAPDSAEYQAHGAWNDLLSSFARLSAVAPQLSQDDALSTLARLAREQVFQPEAPGARIRILGLLEATGLSFDALWVAGMAADAWPQSPEPNPLLPIRWQRERGVPRSTPSRELAFARQLTTMLSQAAPEVVFSYASQADDHVRAPSPLVAYLPRETVMAQPTAAERLFSTRPSLERVVDRLAPAVEQGAILPGGAWMIDAQSVCPLRAVAVHRLRAEAWPAASLGLTASERGKLVHAALAAFWKEAREHAALAAMSERELEDHVTAAVAQARGAIDRARWQAIPPAIGENETICVTTLVRHWLVRERERPPFAVLETEIETTMRLAGYTFNVRLDRVDALASGGIAIVDYKTGGVTPPAKWFDARPQGAQLALYAAAQAQRDPARSVRALIYGKLRPGEVEAVGLADAADVWPGVSTPDTVRGAGLVDWTDAMSKLEASTNGLARACGAGEASVAPREPKVCTYCHLHAVCRIGAAADEAGEGRFEDFDDA